MHKYLKIFLAFALALAGSVALFNLFSGGDGSTNNQNTTRAERRKHRRPPPPREEFSPRVFEGLNLTDEQKTQIENLQSKARAATEAAFEKIKSLDEQLQPIADAEVFDETAARQILTDKSQASIELQLAQLKTEAAVKSVLTDEQKAQFEQMKKPRRPMPPRESE